MSATQDAVAGDLTVVNPATLEEVGRVQSSTPAGVLEAVAESALAQAAWGRTSLAERARVLAAAAHVTLHAVDEIAATVTAETGKPLLEAVTADLFVALENLVWLARNAGGVLRRDRVAMRQPYLLHKRAWLRYEPVGVVGIVSPWNLPFGIPLSQAATVVAAGNGVVLEPAEEAPLSGAWVEEVFRRAGSPAGLVRVAQGAGETGAALLDAPRLAKVVFTGSAEVGRAVAELCAGRLRPVTLELGERTGCSSSAMRISYGRSRALSGARSRTADRCSGIERILVSRELRAEFVERLAARAEALRPGRGESPASDLGPLISETQRARVEELVDDAVAAGARIVTGGRRLDVGLPGWFYAPTVLTDPVTARAPRTRRPSDRS